MIATCLRGRSGDRAAADRDPSPRRAAAAHAGGARSRRGPRRTRGFAEADIRGARGNADAEIIRTKGQAEAEIILAKGQAEAEAMQVKASAYSGYGQAAILDKLLAAAGTGPRVSEPLSQGRQDHDRLQRRRPNGNGIGSAAMVNDVAKMIARPPRSSRG